jgi:hypothetical protein
MKLSDLMKMSPMDIGLLVVFIIYIIFPISTPGFLAHQINTPIGLVAIFGVAVALFAYSSPVIAVIFVFVAYELIRRSSVSRKYTGAIPTTLPHFYDDEYSPSLVGGKPEVSGYPIKDPKPNGTGVRIPQAVVDNLPQKTRMMSTRVPHELPESTQKRDMELALMNPALEISLEEEIVSEYAPLGTSQPIAYHDSEYKPMVEKVDGAMPYNLY